jgi:hypothetical protein
MHDVEVRHIQRLSALVAEAGADQTPDDALLFELELVEEDEEGQVLLSKRGQRVAGTLDVDRNLAAAWLIWASLSLYTGRRLKIDRYRAIAAPVLERKRLAQSKYEVVLRIGQDAGLFTIDIESGSYPFFVPATWASLSMVDEEQELEEPEEVVEPLQRERPLVPPERTPPPEDWDPPGYLDCGHMNWDSDEANAEARENGFCCAGGEKRMPVNHRFTRGKYRKPVPKSLRYSEEKKAMGGFPGLVCDEDGYYIGGATNSHPDRRGRR